MWFSLLLAASADFLLVELSANVIKSQTKVFFIRILRLNHSVFYVRAAISASDPHRQQRPGELRLICENSDYYYPSSYPANALNHALDYFDETLSVRSLA